MWKIAGLILQCWVWFSLTVRGISRHKDYWCLSLSLFFALRYGWAYLLTSKLHGMLRAESLLCSVEENLVDEEDSKNTCQQSLILSAWCSLAELRQENMITGHWGQATGDRPGGDIDSKHLVNTIPGPSLHSISYQEGEPRREEALYHCWVRIEENLPLSWKMTTSIFITVWMQMILRLNHVNFPNFSFLRRLCFKLPFPIGALNSEYYKPSLLPKPASTQTPETRQDLWQCLGLLEIVWALLFPGMRNKPSWAAAVPAWPHSFAGIICPFLAWVLTSLILGVQDLASGPVHPRILHATWSLFSSGTRTRCCCSPILFPWDMFRKV